MHTNEPIPSAGDAVQRAEWRLSLEQVDDLELLLSGGFWPLTAYLCESEFRGVCVRMRLADGSLWPIPLALDVTREFARGVSPGMEVGLWHPDGVCIAVLRVADVWVQDWAAEAEGVFGTTDLSHPGVYRLRYDVHPCRLGGSVHRTAATPRHSFRDLRLSPTECKAAIATLGWERTVAFQTRNPMHRAHVEMTLRAMGEVRAGLLLHPVVGRTAMGDVDPWTRVRCYRAIVGRYPERQLLLSVLDLSMRLAGPKEAVWHALIRRNFGATHFIVGRSHADPGAGGDGRQFYEPYEAHALLEAHREELGICPLLFEELAYSEDTGKYITRAEAPPGTTLLSCSGSALREQLRRGLEIAPWISYPEVIAVLRDQYPPRERRGFVVLLTGLPAAGKSTIAAALAERLRDLGPRRVTTLDGDEVRKLLSSELGFSRADRELNIRRIAFVASEIARNGGAVICAAIAPFRGSREAARTLIEGHSGFLEVYIATPLAVCAARDPKGLYARARAGELVGLTGIDDPYEAPVAPDIVLDAERLTPTESSEIVLRHLEKLGYLAIAK